MTFRRPRPRRRRPADTEARGALAALCVTVTVSQGVLFYAFPVLGPAIAEDTGWSLPIVIVLFSGSQVMAGLSGPFVARWLRLRGPRAVMTAAALLGPSRSSGSPWPPTCGSSARPGRWRGSPSPASPIRPPSPP
ncbi:hypothetical protein HFP72_01690 [Nocardiopsis sp. ARC36]